jgi:hypothetical protein
MHTLGIAVAQSAKRRQRKLFGRPVVEVAEPRLDDTDVQHVAEPMLRLDVGVDVITEWIAIRQHAR